MKPSALSVQNLTVFYASDGPEQAADGPRPAAIRDVSFELAPGSWTAIIGSNGSGKSTLAKAIAGLEPARTGRIERADGATVWIVLQNPETQLLGDTVLEELMLCAPQGEQEEAADEAGTREWAAAVLGEAGLDVPLDMPVGQLSGGQKQLLNVAACLAARADIVVLDEVTSMLDPASRERVLALVRSLHGKGTTVIWITHHSEELVYAERVLMLDEGRIVYDGETRDFLYGTSPALPSPCEQCGWESPFIVRVVKALAAKGVSLARRPLLPEELSQALSAYADPG